MVQSLWRRGSDALLAWSAALGIFGQDLQTGYSASLPPGSCIHRFHYHHHFNNVELWPVSPVVCWAVRSDPPELADAYSPGTSCWSWTVGNASISHWDLACPALCGTNWPFRQWPIAPFPNVKSITSTRVSYVQLLWALNFLSILQLHLLIMHCAIVKACKGISFIGDSKSTDLCSMTETAYIAHMNMEAFV